MNPPPVPPESDPPVPPSVPPAAPPSVPCSAPPRSSEAPPPPRERYPLPTATMGDRPSAGLKTVWVGCGVLLLVAAVALVLAVNWTYDKFKEFAGSPDKVAETLLKATLSANPDVEFLDVDRKTRSARVRDRKSGEIMTISYDDAKNGSITLRKSDGTTAELGAEGIRVTDNKGGELVLGPGEVAKLPPWVPVYPGKATVTTSSKAGENSGFRLMMTGESAADAVRHWGRAFADAGFSCEASGKSVDGAGFFEVKGAKDAGTSQEKHVEVFITSGVGRPTEMRLSHRSQ